MLKIVRQWPAPTTVSVSFLDPHTPCSNLNWKTVPTLPRSSPGCSTEGLNPNCSIALAALGFEMMGILSEICSTHCTAETLQSAWDIMRCTWSILRLDLNDYMCLPFWKHQRCKCRLRSILSRVGRWQWSSRLWVILGHISAIFDKRWKLWPTHGELPRFTIASKLSKTSSGRMDWAVSRRFPRNAQLWPKKTSEQNRPDILHAMWLAISERKGVMLIAQTYTPNLKGNIYIYKSTMFPALATLQKKWCAICLLDMDLQWAGFS